MKREEKLFVFKYPPLLYILSINTRIYDEFLSHNGKHVDYAAIPESEVFMKVC